jgi:hypothetical protein
MTLYTVQVDVVIRPTIDDDVQDEVRERLFEAASGADTRTNHLGAVTSFWDDYAALVVLVDAESSAGAWERAQEVIHRALEPFVVRGDLGSFTVDKPTLITQGRSPAYDIVLGADGSS